MDTNHVFSSVASMLVNNKLSYTCFQLFGQYLMQLTGHRLLLNRHLPRFWFLAEQCSSSLHGHRHCQLVICDTG